MRFFRVAIVSAITVLLASSFVVAQSTKAEERAKQRERHDEFLAIMKPLPPAEVALNIALAAGIQKVCESRYSLDGWLLRLANGKARRVSFQNKNTKDQALERAVSAFSKRHGGAKADFAKNNCKVARIEQEQKTLIGYLLVKK